MLWGAIFMSPTTRTHSYPYVLIAPGLFCIFDDGELDEVAPLKKGEIVGVVGVVTDFAPSKEGVIVPILYECSIECTDGCQKTE